MDLSFNEVMTLFTILGGGLGALGAWLSKSYFPYRQRIQDARIEEAAKQREHERVQAERLAEEQTKQRDFDREMQRAKLMAESSGEDNIWRQMVELQTKLMAQNEEFSSFIISLATERADNSDRIAREDMKDVMTKWAQASHELRELRTSLSILVQDASRREEERAFLKKLPEYILDMISRQEIFYDSVKEILKGGQNVQVT